jgi:hypothetical protein
MLGVSWKTGAWWVAIMALAGCQPQPRAINTGPLLAIPCLFICNTELAIEAIEDNASDVTGGAQSQSMQTGEVEPPDE